MKDEPPIGCYARNLKHVLNLIHKPGVGIMHGIMHKPGVGIMHKPGVGIMHGIMHEPGVGIMQKPRVAIMLGACDEPILLARGHNSVPMLCCILCQFM